MEGADPTQGSGHGAQDTAGSGLGGLYYNPAEPVAAQVRREGRDLFLGAIREHVPAVLQTLRDDVLPVFLRADFHDSELTEQAVRSRLIRTLLTAADGEPAPELVAAFRERFLAWADRFHLRTEWVLDQALNLLANWQRNPEIVMKWGPLVSFEYHVSLADEWFDQASEEEKAAARARPDHLPEPLRFRFDPWFCHRQIRDTYAREARRAFGAELQKYLDERERIAKEEWGWRKMPGRRTHDPETSPSIDFELLARWQCDVSLTRKRLAAEYDITYDQLAERLEWASRVVGIQPRPARRGRPRKTGM